MIFKVFQNVKYLEVIHRRKRVFKEKQGRQFGHRSGEHQMMDVIELFFGLHGSLIGYLDVLMPCSCEAKGFKKVF